MSRGSGSRVWEIRASQRIAEREQRVVRELTSIFLASHQPLIRRAVQWIAWLILYGPYRRLMAGVPETRTGEQRVTVLQGQRGKNG